KPSCPRFVIFLFQLEQIVISCPACQEKRVVSKRIFGVVVLAETFLKLVIIVVYTLTCPNRMALYSKMVIGADCKVASSGSGLQYSLRHFDTRRNAVFTHFFFCKFFEIFNIKRINLLVSSTFRGFFYYRFRKFV